MKNITISVDDGIYRRARIRAAEQGTSVSALVRGFLNGLEETEFDTLKREEIALRNSVTVFSASRRLTREEIHDRAALR